MAGRLEGKVAIIVGAGQQPGETIGNGRAVARRFAEEGATCLLVDFNEDWVRETLEYIAPLGSPASVLQADIREEIHCARLTEVCVDRYGRIDILHNNVGRSKGDQPTFDQTLESWNDLIATNLTGMFLTCKHVLPVMRAQGSGAIVNMSSTSSLSARPTVTYKTTKGAVNTMTQHIAMENARHGVRANVIVPGLIDTPMAIERRAAESGQTREAIRAQRDAMVPMGTMGSAWDVAEAAVFLASDQARYITGVLLPVDGGLLLKRG
ncbi:MAG: SDR family oxidoreductase [Rhodospirillum sp.]|nr:SDR family oxidoreductase [Rhodospirillum sp.]MCF8488408.1 SDR family oxidoreductase [Rhodospirillum sp.]MCF8501770.1 SDR family oxidoreductase [Rhodospirillum sp.]